MQQARPQSRFLLKTYTRFAHETTRKFHHRAPRHRVSGALIFDADGSSRQKNNPVPAGLAFGSPEWTELFVHACREAKCLDLEPSLNIQSGWNLGGPELTEEQTTQHLVWSRASGLLGPVKLVASVR